MHLQLIQQKSAFNPQWDSGTLLPAMIFDFSVLFVSSGFILHTMLQTAISTPTSVCCQMIPCKGLISQRKGGGNKGRTKIV
ncbi:hypothetical protein FKM82_007541 [Ascaphus truei]